MLKWYLNLFGSNVAFGAFWERFDFVFILRYFMFSCRSATSKGGWRSLLPYSENWKKSYNFGKKHELILFIFGINFWFKILFWEYPGEKSSESFPTWPFFHVWQMKCLSKITYSALRDSLLLPSNEQKIKTTIIKRRTICFDMVQELNFKPFLGANNWNSRHNFQTL